MLPLSMSSMGDAGCFSLGGELLELAEVLLLLPLLLLFICWPRRLVCCSRREWILLLPSALEMHMYISTKIAQVFSEFLSFWLKNKKQNGISLLVFHLKWICTCLSNECALRCLSTAMVREKGVRCNKGWHPDWNQGCCSYVHPPTSLLLFSTHLVFFTAMLLLSFSSLYSPVSWFTMRMHSFMYGLLDPLKTVTGALEP